MKFRSGYPPCVLITHLYIPNIFSPTTKSYMSAPFCPLIPLLRKIKFLVSSLEDNRLSRCSFLANKAMIFNFYTELGFNLFGLPCFVLF